MRGEARAGPGAPGLQRAGPAGAGYTTGLMLVDQGGPGTPGLAQEPATARQGTLGQRVRGC